MRYIYPKTIFVNEDGEVINNNYDKARYFQKKQWYERKIEKGDRITDDKTINQRFVMLGEIKTRQLQFEFK